MNSAPAEGRGHAHGKLILLGEHAVVYGHPGVAVAISLGTRAHLRARPGPTSLVDGDADERLTRALHGLLGPTGWAVQLQSDLPMGRGMGSSAALSVALVRAYADAIGRDLSAEALWDEVFTLERVFHGDPSGLDHATAARGGALRFRRGPPPSFEPLPCPALPLVVLDSGQAGDTAAQVRRVAEARPRVDATLDAIGALVRETSGDLFDLPALGAAMTRNHALLVDLGVSTPRLDALVDLALAHGALGAKLAGSGGGGVVVALAPEPDALLRAAAHAGHRALVCQVEPA